MRILDTTAYPTAPWAVQLGRHLLLDLKDAGSKTRFLIRDRDSKLTPTLDVPAGAGVQVRVHAEQQSPRLARCDPGSRAPFIDFIHGYGMRRCRCKNQAKAHGQYVLTRIERPGRKRPSAQSSPARLPMAPSLPGTTGDSSAAILSDRH